MGKFFLVIVAISIALVLGDGRACYVFLSQ
jgi:hypothetical protein